MQMREDVADTLSFIIGTVILGVGWLNKLGDTEDDLACAIRFNENAK